MGTVADIIQRGTRAGQPAATAVSTGSLYYVTDENVTERSNGTIWEDCTDAGGAGLADGDKGDITVSASGATWTIDNDVVTFAKMQNIATAKLLGRATASSGDIEEITLGTNLSYTGTTLNAAGGGSADSILGQSGVGGGRISGLQPLVNPGGGSDDEFDTTDSSDPLTGWTTMGAPTAHDTNVSRKSHYRLSATSGGNLVGIYKAWSPSNGSMVTAQLNAASPFTTNYQRAAFLMVGEATPGKVAAIGLTYDSGATKLVVDLWTTPSSFGSTPGSLTITGAVVAAVLMSPIYLRIVYNSSTSLDYQFSFNGIIWTTVLGAHNPSLTVGSAGLACQYSGASVESYWDWIRFA